jgi:putative transposase
MIKPHALYQGLGPTPELRQASYQALFDSCIPQATLEEIREMTNKAWLLGSDRFREGLEARLNNRCQKQKVGRPKVG